MPFLYKFTLGEDKEALPFVGSGEMASLIYHDIFDFPLTASELIHWSVGKDGILEKLITPTIETKKGFYFIKGKEGIIYKRILRERISERKIKIAKKAASILKIIPSIKMLAITGALSMKNASEDSDVDFLIVTKKGSLWTTRLITLVMLTILRFPMRKFGDKNQKDKLCLNMWLDEGVLVWDKEKRNIFTSHEIAQIRPLIDKDETYRKFIKKNSWIKKYWPNAIYMTHEPRVVNYGQHKKSVARRTLFIFQLMEKLAFWLQYRYMKKKITREIVLPTRAIFHPHDWSQVVLNQLTT